MQKRGKYVQTIESTSANGTKKTLWSCIWVFIWTRYKIKPTKTSENGNLKVPIISLWANHPSTINCDLRFFWSVPSLCEVPQIREQMLVPDILWYEKSILGWFGQSGSTVKKSLGLIMSDLFSTTFIVNFLNFVPT